MYCDIKIIEAEVLTLLESVCREGMSDLIEYIKTKTNYFSAPASTKFHNSRLHGLLIHHYKVYWEFNQFCKLYNFGRYIFKDTIIICGLLHDICKANLYDEYMGTYSYNSKELNSGHGKYSIEILERFIKLTDEEKEIIKYHMGIYFTTEFVEYGEYTTHELTKVMHENPLVYIFQLSDDKAAKDKNDDLSKEMMNYLNKKYNVDNSKTFENYINTVFT